MSTKYSRLTEIEKRRNVRKTLFYITASVVLVVVLFFWGLPVMAKFASLFSNLKKVDQPILKDDITPPIPPVFDFIGDVTNEIKMEITGSAEPGSTVIVYFNNKSAESVADTEGRFSQDVILNEGVNTFLAFSKDNYGNESQKTKTHKITYDDKPPELEIIKPEDKSGFFGSRERQLTIEGKTETDSSLEINGHFVIVDNDGFFSFLTSLTEGTTDFKIIAKDKAGNTTDHILSVSFTS